MIINITTGNTILTTFQNRVHLMLNITDYVVIFTNIRIFLMNRFKNNEPKYLDNLV